MSASYRDHVMQLSKFIVAKFALRVTHPEQAGKLSVKLTVNSLTLTPHTYSHTHNTLWSLPGSYTCKLTSMTVLNSHSRTYTSDCKHACASTLAREHKFVLYILMLKTFIFPTNTQSHTNYYLKHLNTHSRTYTPTHEFIFMYKGTNTLTVTATFCVKLLSRQKCARVLDGSFVHEFFFLTYLCTTTR